MKEYLQYIRKFIWSSVKPSAREWFWVIVVAAALAFLVLFGILRYKMKFSVADSGYIGWQFTARAAIIALISTAAILLAVLVTVGTAIYKRDKRLATEQAEEAENAVAEKTDGEQESHQRDERRIDADHHGVKTGNVSPAREGAGNAGYLTERLLQGNAGHVGLYAAVPTVDEDNCRAAIVTLRDGRRRGVIDLGGKVVQ